MEDRRLMEQLNHEGILLHLSSIPITHVKISSLGDMPICHWKPRGLWYGCGTGWLDWGLEELAGRKPPRGGRRPVGHLCCYLYQIILTPQAKILHIRSLKELLSFHRKYGGCQHNLQHNYEGIKWRQVAADFHGIEMCPYFHLTPKQQLTYPELYDWYRTWEMASGCLWNNRVIQELRLVYHKDSRSESTWMTSSTPAISRTSADSSVKTQEPSEQLKTSDAWND